MDKVKIKRTIEEIEVLLHDLKDQMDLNLENRLAYQKVKIDKNKYTGPTGGARKLYDVGFFKEKRSLSNVRKELGNNGYYYSRQAVHEALKTLSGKNGPLVSLKEGKNKLYVERK